MNKLITGLLSLAVLGMAGCYDTYPDWAGGNTVYRQVNVDSYHNHGYPGYGWHNNYRDDYRRDQYLGHTEVGHHGEDLGHMMNHPMEHSMSHSEGHVSEHSGGHTSSHRPSH